MEGGWLEIIGFAFYLTTIKLINFRTQRSVYILNQDWQHFSINDMINMFFSVPTTQLCCESKYSNKILLKKNVVGEVWPTVGTLLALVLNQ